MQKGIASLIILIGLAIVIGITAIGFGYYAIQSASPRKDSIELPPQYLVPPSQQALGTPECPDIDYTGCDTSSEWMTWDGSGLESSETSSGSTILVK